MASATGLTNAAGTRNTRYYTSLFNQYESAEGAWKPSWNWAAFVCSTGWFFFRRMFLFGVINLALLLLVALPYVVHLTPGESTIAKGALLLYAVLAFGALPATAAELPPVGSARLHPNIKLADLAPGGIVRVVFTGFRHIEARSVEIVPTLGDKTVEWRCYNIDMPDKELPAQCRVTRARPATPVKAG